MTAKHVIDGIATAQSWGPTSVASSPFAREPIPSLESNRLKAMSLGANTGDVWDVAYVNYNASTDIAALLLTPQDDGDAQSRLAIPLDTSVPKVGDEVHLISQNQLAANEHAPPTNRDGKGQVFSLERTMSIRVGEVTGVYQDGFRQFKWPAFTTTIPAEPGMSGGLVFLPGAGFGKTVSARGVVSSDFSEEEARKNQTLPGMSVIASSWVALALRVPSAIPWRVGDVSLPLLTMIERGQLIPPIGGVGNFRLIERGGEELTLHRLGAP